MDEGGKKRMPRTIKKYVFKKMNKILGKTDLLIHCDPKNIQFIACGASTHNFRTALSHRMLDGSEKPIIFACRTLPKAERKYSPPATTLIVSVVVFLWLNG